MTLIMSVPCKDGLLICTDKRTVGSSDVVESIFVDDSTNKIYRIDKSMAFTTNGNCTVCRDSFDGETKEVQLEKRRILFDADAMIRRFYASENPVSIENNFGILGKKLKEAYR